ncbi:hypothetical protein O0L34_g6213 [Tuta absoluta]|nr:hypothetical protein O0L34_g6213 [Tuta absoluta]
MSVTNLGDNVDSEDIIPPSPIIQFHPEIRSGAGRGGPSGSSALAATQSGPSGSSALGGVRSGPSGSSAFAARSGVSSGSCTLEAGRSRALPSFEARRGGPADQSPFGAGRDGLSAPGVLGAGQDRPPAPHAFVGRQAGLPAPYAYGAVQGTQPSSFTLSGRSTEEPVANQTLNALTTILENMTRQQQVSMQANHEFLAGLLSQTVAPRKRPRLSDVYIAPFNPDGDVPVRDWCEHVDKAKSHWDLTDYEVCTKIASLLQGRAKTLGDTWLVKSPVWNDMKEALIQTFEPEARYSNDVVKLRNFKFGISNPVESITRAWNIWKRVVSGDKEKDAVEAVIGCIDNEFLRLRLLSSKCSSVPELISVAATIKQRESRQGEPPDSSQEGTQDSVSAVDGNHPTALQESNAHEGENGTLAVSENEEF